MCIRIEIYSFVYYVHNINAFVSLLMRINYRPYINTEHTDYTPFIFNCALVGFSYCFQFLFAFICLVSFSPFLSFSFLSFRNFFFFLFRFRFKFSIQNKCISMWVCFCVFISYRCTVTKPFPQFFQCMNTFCHFTQFHAISIDILGNWIIFIILFNHTISIW